MINRLKSFFNSEPRPTHKIVQCETKLLESKDGSKWAIFIAADLYDSSALDVLIGDLVERFKVHRMVSHPDTCLLLITIVGRCEVSDVAARWRKVVVGDKIAGVWMARMEKADIGVAPRSGPMTTTGHSILPENRA
jgi:hypothetical protein